MWPPARAIEYYRTPTSGSEMAIFLERALDDRTVPLQAAGHDSNRRNNSMRPATVAIDCCRERWIAKPPGSHGRRGNSGSP